MSAARTGRTGWRVALAGTLVAGGVVAGGLAFPTSVHAAPPGFSKVFVPDEIGPGSVSTLTFTIDNSGEAAPADELAFSDTLPAGVVIATPPNAGTTCDPDAGGSGPVLSAPAGGSTISLSDAGVGAGVSCTVSVDVTSTTAATHTNTSGDLTSSAGNSGTATDDLLVATNRPGFLKDFSPDPIDRGERSTLTLTIDNSSNGSAVTFATFSDTLPAGLVIADPADASTTCVNTAGSGLTAEPGTDTISFEAIALAVVAASSTCEIELDVVATGSGTLINSTDNLQTTVAATARTAGKATASLDVLRSDLHITKEFTDDPIPPGATAQVAFTIENFDRGFPATGVGFTDTLPAGVVVATPANVASDCGGTVTAAGTSISLTGGTVPAEGTCTITLDVTAPAAGTFTNETSAVTGTVDGSAVTGNTGKDDLFVVPAPILTKEFTDDPVGPGDVATIHFELTDTTTAGGSSDIAFTDNLTDVLSALATPTSTISVAGSTHTTVAFQRWSTLEPVGLSGTVQYGDGVGTNLDGCIPFAAGTLTGLVVIVDDGGCTTTAKIQNIDAGGAVAGLVGTPDIFTFPMNTAFAGGPRPTIPGYEVYKPQADAIKAAAGATATIDTRDVAVPLPDFCGAGSALDYVSLGFDEFGLSMTGGNLGTGATCMFDVTMPIPVGTASGSYPNETSRVTATVAAMTVTGGKASDDLVVIAGPFLTKEFTSDPITPGDSVTLEFTLTNDNPPMPPVATDFTATGIGFTDDLASVAAGLTLGSVDSNDCGGSVTGVGTTTISFSGGTLAPDSSCTIVVTVDSTTSTPQGVHENTTSEVTSTVAGITATEQPASDELAVIDLTLTKEFTDDPVFAGDTVTLEFTIDNTSPTDDATSISFSDDLTETLDPPGPGSLAVSASETLPKSACGGTVSGSTIITFSGGSVPAGTDCSFTVMLDVPGTADAGTYPNATSGFLATIGGSPISLPNATDDLVVDEAALTIAKSFTDDPVEPGDNVTLVITLGNDTLSEPATALAFTDDLEATLSGLTATGVFPMIDACIPVGAGTATGTLAITGTQTLDFSGGTLGAGEACEITLTLSVPGGAAAANYPNTTSTLTGDVAGNPVVATAATDVLKVFDPPSSSADLSIAKTDSPDPVKAGGTLTYTITVDNAGPSDAANVIVTDMLPAGVTYVSDTDSCVEGPVGTLTCSLGIVPIVPGSVSFDVEVTVDSDTPAGTLTNTASVTSNTSDPDTSNNSASEDTTVEVEADLSITKVDLVDPVLAGEMVIYTITVDNLGPSDATNVTVVDTVPAGLMYLSDTDSCVPGVPGPGLLTCDLGTIPAGSNAAFDVTFDVDPAAPAGDVDNVVDVSSDVTDPDPSDNTATETTTIATEADLAISKIDDPDPVIAGEAVTYTITVDNFGPSDATNVTVVDTVPPGLMYVSDTDSCTPGVPGPGLLTCDLGTIAASSGASFDVTFDVDPAAPAGDVDNVVDVSSDVTDPDPSDNTATETTTIAASADLSITKVDSPDPVVAGTELTYTIEVDNTGPSDATGVVVNDVLPAGTTLVASSGCGEDPSGVPTCTLGTIAAGGSASYALTVLVGPAVTGSIQNDATVSSDAADPDPSDNTASATTAVISSADVSVTKTDGVTSVVPGSGTDLVYTIVVSNAGPSADPAVAVADTFPAALTCTYTSAAAGGATGNTASGSGNLADTVNLPVGSSVTYTATCAVDAGTTATISNTATATASVSDPNTANNSATDTTEPAPAADVSVSKTDGRTQVAPGNTTVYTIVVSNAGPSPAPVVTVGDAFPAELDCTWTSTASGGATGNDPTGAGNISDTLAMPAGSDVTYTAQCAIDPAATGTLSNTASATVGSGVALIGAGAGLAAVDPNTANNSATDTTQLTPEADLSITKDDGRTDALAGQNALVYTIRVSNAGPSNDPAAKVVDNFPAPLTCTWTSVAAGGATGNSASGSGNINDTLNLPPGSSVTYTATCSTARTASGTISNTATVTASVTDPNTANNSATDANTQLRPPQGLPATGGDSGGLAQGALLALVAGLGLLALTRFPRRQTVRIASSKRRSRG